jgi:hypothetical protein
MNLKQSSCQVRRSEPEQETGATIVEFALIASVFFLFLLFIVDAAIAFFHYALLAHSVTFMTRRIALDVEAGTTKSALMAASPERISDYIHTTFGSDSSLYNFSVDTIALPGGGCEVVVTGMMTDQCLACYALNRVLLLRTASSALIEDECFQGPC